MDTKQLQYFLNLAKTLNFTDAAKLSSISQPTLTKAIKRLEEEYGGLLIYRDGKDSRLTELGRTLGEQFQNVIAAEDRARDLAEMIVKGRRSIINVGVSSTLGPRRFAEFFENAINQHREYRFVLHRISPLNATDMVLSGALDCCLCTDFDDQNSKLLVTNLYTERLLLACGRRHRFANLDSIPMHELNGESYLDRLGCEFRIPSYQTLVSKNVAIEPCLQSDAEDWIQSFVAAGIGVSLMPEFSPVSDDIVLRPVQDVEIVRNVQFVSIFGSPTAESVMNLRDIAMNFPWQAQTADRTKRAT